MSRHPDTRYEDSSGNWVQELAQIESDDALLIAWDSLNRESLIPPSDVVACLLLLRLANKLCIEARYKEAEYAANTSLQISILI